MSRPKSEVKTERFTIYIPEDVRKRMDELLFNPEKGRVVKGSYNTFIIEVLKRELRSSEAKVKKMLES